MTQEEVLTILKTGANVFLTGEPGSGKTHTVNQYVTWLRERGIEPAITASTGIAATHIGGFTIHSWSGIGIRRDLTAYDVDAITQNKTVALRVRDARVLIIDEVSMLSSKTLSMAETVCREIKRTSEPFGGLQVVLVGDFFQLPPVQKKEDPGSEDMFSGGSVFAFGSSAWKTLNPLVCYLSEQYRQEDAVFLELLSAVRRGDIEDSHRELLRTRFTQTPQEGVTHLYTHNADVNAINDTELSKINGTAKTFPMIGRGSPNLIEALKRGCLSPDVLTLKIGARVMFTKNDVVMHKYVNGTLGTVVGFSKEGGYPIVKTHAGRFVTAEPEEWKVEDNGKVLASITQIPLRLAWAITVHKSQGMSLDAAHVDLSRTFEYGQGYVALSRVRTLAGLSLSGINERALEVHPEILEKDEEFRTHARATHDAFAKIPAEEIKTMHARFVKAVGGSETPSAVKEKKTSRASTYEKTKELLLQHRSLANIAKERGVTPDTIVSHIEKLAQQKSIDPLVAVPYLLKGKEHMVKEVHRVLKGHGKSPLKPLYESLHGKVPYDILRLARLIYRE